MIRRTLKVFFLLCAISFSFAVQTASASDIPAIDINVQLNDDGSARIVQEWEVNVYGKGSELYIPQTRLGDMEIKDFSVSDNSGENYINEGMGWDSKRSVKEKSGRYGIAKTDEGFELCWGRGSDGKRTFRVSWTFTNFIKSYDDYDGFIVRLVNDKMSPAPERVRITLQKPGHPFVKGEVDMWAFGFKGKIIPEDGKIIVTSEQSLSKDNHVTVMLRFAKGIFKPLSKVSGSFKAVEDRAMEGAHHEGT